MRPLPYKFANGGTVLGQYAVAHKSGAIAATPSALDVWSRIRWNPSTSNAKCVLIRLRVGLSVITAVTTTVQHILQASIARSFTVDFSTAITNTSMAGDSGKLYKGMASSLMGTAGPGICTTAPCTGQTYTLDPSPFAILNLPPLSPTLGSAAVTEQVGTGSEMYDLYNWYQLGGRPPTLSANEGVVIQNTVAGHATGTIALLAEWTWAEAINPFNDD